MGNGKRFRVRQNFDAYTPATWQGTDYERCFGRHNEGRVFSADSPEDMRQALREGRFGHLYRLNPSLLLITEEA